jgi:hypothetical protein
MIFTHACMFLYMFPILCLPYTRISKVSFSLMFDISKFVVNSVIRHVKNQNMKAVVFADNVQPCMLC